MCSAVNRRNHYIADPSEAEATRPLSGIFLPPKRQSKNATKTDSFYVVAAGFCGPDMTSTTFKIKRLIRNYILRGRI